MIKLVAGLFHNEVETKAKLCEFIQSTDRLSIGPECEKFEKDFAAWQGRQHCVLFNSGSSANLALVQALLNLKRIHAGDTAAFSAITWATNVMPLVQLGLIPLPADIELDTLNVSSQTFQALLDQGADLKLLFLTNLLGFCSDIDRIKSICETRGIILIEDNCESLGTIYEGTKLGNWGLASTFSFFVGHHLSTIEGGAVCTDDAELARMLRLVRAHGWDRNLAEDEKQQLRDEHGIDETFFANFTFYALGYNLRPTEITGFLGNVQLPHLDAMVRQRHENFLQLHSAISQNPDILPLRYDHLELVSNFAVPIVGASRQAAERHIAALTRADVETRPLVGGAIPDQPFYKKLYGETAGIAAARQANQHGFYFANHEGLSAAEIDVLTAALAQNLPVPA